MKISEVASYLGCSRRTVERRIQQGALEGRHHGPAFSSPTLVPSEQVFELIKVRRDMELADAITEKRDPGWEYQVRELNRRAGKLAAVIGREPILDLLQRYGVTRFDQLHPNQMRSVYGNLLRLGRLNEPYIRDGGVSVAEEGLERRRQKRAANRKYPGQRGAPRKPPSDDPKVEAARKRSRESASASRARLARENDRMLKQVSWRPKE